MQAFTLQDGRLCAEAVPLEAIAEQVGTPAYVYSKAAIASAWQGFDQALGDHPHLVCYAVKANSNLAVLQQLARLGSGFDIVSGGELERVLAAGGDPRRVVFSGVGKTAGEMRRALEVGIRCFNVESAAELTRLDRVAGELRLTAPVSLRVNPDVDAGTHPYISTGLRENKFGIDIRDAEALYRQAAEAAHLRVEGVDFHIGSQLTDLAPIGDALERVLELVDRLTAQGITIRHLDVGGGLGIRYRDETPPAPEDYARVLLEGLRGRDLVLLMEPGRAVVGNAGVLITRVEYLKNGPEQRFAIVDAAMNDLLRPSLYDAWQAITPVQPREDTPTLPWDIVGPVCETGDFLGKQRELALAEGDLLAVHSAGAYGFVMASNYNTRPRPPEVLVDGDRVHLVREREPLRDLWRGEYLLS